MRQLLRTVSALIALALACTPAWGKGAITKIVLEGQTPQLALEIDDPAILDRFTIWSGPGVGGWDMLRTIPKAEDAKFIVDWTQGIVTDPPRNALRYLVRMYIEGRESPRDTYEVEYVIDRTDNAGYVYLPGQHDDFGHWNTFQIYRGVEGRWFRASRDWEEMVRPLLVKE
jgi:hypothetical protein